MLYTEMVNMQTMWHIFWDQGAGGEQLAQENWPNKIETERERLLFK